MNNIILLIGASGSGKTTLGKELEKWLIPQLISYTTRPIRAGEKQDVDYYFVDNEFLSSLRSSDVIEKTTYDNNEYGLFRIEVENKLKDSDVYFVCNKDGAEQIIEQYPDKTRAYWFKMDEETIRERLEFRGDSTVSINNRITHAYQEDEFSPPKFSHTVLNGKDSTNKNLKEILK